MGAEQDKPPDDAPAEGRSEQDKPTEDVTPKERLASDGMWDDQGPAEELAMAGDVVGAYELVECVGAGGMGQVWDARHREHGKRAAVKLILRDAYGDLDRDRIAHEFKQLVSLRHDRIVSVVDAGLHVTRTGESVPFVVMDYLPGARTLTEYAERNKLGLHRRLALFLDACDAVAYVHEAGAVHLDLKPDNILVDTDGAVFLTDFGIARPVLGWTSKRVAGTDGYMAPEQREGDIDRIDKRADVWALGAVMHDVVTGAQRGEVPLPLTNVRPELLAESPPVQLRELDSIINRCTASDRSARFDDAGALRTALRAALEGKGFRFRVGIFARSSPREAIIVLLVLIATLTSMFSGVGTNALLSRWRAPLAWYERVLPPPSITDSNQLEHVAILEFDTDTANSLTGTAGLQQLDPKTRGTYRWIHAAAIRRLVDAGARAIVLDLRFRSTRPNVDGLLADAIRYAFDKDVSVVVGAYWKLVGGAPEMSPEVWSAEPLWGGLTVAPESTGGHGVTLMLEREGIPGAMPGIALAGYAAFRMPGHGFLCERDGDRVRLRMYRQAVGTGDLWARFSTQTVNEDLLGAGGLERGDLETNLIFGMPATEVLDASTTRYEEVWSDGIRGVVDGKAVIVVDREFDGRVLDMENRLTDLRGGLVHAAALECLILESAVRGPAWMSIMVTVGGSLVAAAFGLWIATRRRPCSAFLRFVLVCGGIAAVAAFVPLAVWLLYLMCSLRANPIPGILAALLAGVVSWAVARRSPWAIGATSV